MVKSRSSSKFPGESLRSFSKPAERFLHLGRQHDMPCGYFGDLKRECRCGPVQFQRYRQRISGPTTGANTSRGDIKRADITGRPIYTNAPDGRGGDPRALPAFEKRDLPNETMRVRIDMFDFNPRESPPRSHTLINSECSGYARNVAARQKYSKKFVRPLNFP